MHQEGGIESEVRNASDRGKLNKRCETTGRAEHLLQIVTSGLKCVRPETRQGQIGQAPLSAMLCSLAHERQRRPRNIFVCSLAITSRLDPTTAQQSRHIYAHVARQFLMLLPRMDSSAIAKIASTYVLHAKSVSAELVRCMILGPVMSTTSRSPSLSCPPQFRVSDLSSSSMVCGLCLARTPWSKSTVELCSRACGRVEEG